MSAWASHPITTEVMTAATFVVKHKDRAVTALGSAFRSNGDRMEASFCPGAEEASFAMGSGGAPTIENTKLVDWFIAHWGHALTHLGAILSKQGEPGDVWYCQKDHNVCNDTKS